MACTYRVDGREMGATRDEAAWWRTKEAVPPDVKNFVFCGDCDLPASVAPNLVVLPCVHVMCMPCLERRGTFASGDQTLQCPRCTTPGKIPKGGLQGFPADSFSTVLNNSLLGKKHYGIRAIPRCGIHPGERLSCFCLLCAVQACVLCLQSDHLGHENESLEFTAENLDRELTGIITVVTENNMDRLSRALGNLQEQRRRMLGDIGKALGAFSSRPLSGSSQILPGRVLQSQGHGNTFCYQQVAILLKTFEDSLSKMESLHDSLGYVLSFIDILHSCGNSSDKVSRIPGIREKICCGKLLSGKNIEMETLTWQYDAQNRTGKLVRQVCAVQTPDSQGQESIFPCLELVRTISVSCKSAYATRVASLLDQKHIIHTCIGIHRNTFCIHDSNGKLKKRVVIRGMRECASPAVVNGKSGLVVVADQVESWTGDSMSGKSSTHLSGHLHWLTLDEAYDIVQHEVTPIQCVQVGTMNYSSKDKHLLVLTLCTSGQHPKQLCVYSAENRRCIRQINLPYMLTRPFGALHAGEDSFAVNDLGTHKVWWINWKGDVLRQYDVVGPYHAIAHSNDMLIVTSRFTHQLHVVSCSKGTFSGRLLAEQVWHPMYLNLDEKEGLLGVVQGKDADHIEVKMFHFSTPRIREIMVYM